MYAEIKFSKVFSILLPSSTHTHQNISQTERENPPFFPFFKSAHIQILKSTEQKKSLIFFSSGKRHDFEGHNLQFVNKFLCQP